MNIILQKTIISITSILLLLLLIPAGCGGGSGGGNGGDDPVPAAEVVIGALPFGKTTVFRVTVKSVSGLSGASSYNLIGEDTTSAAKPFNEQVENYVINKTTITLEIYNTDGNAIASVILDSNDYKTEFTGTLNLTQNSSLSAFITAGTSGDFITSPTDINTGYSYIPEQSASSQAQIDNLDILASGIIDNLTVTNNTRHIQVPLNCGPNTSGTLQPAADEGFFIINDVMIEFNYAFDNPVAFNDVFTVKFIESDRNFDNMKLYFRLPGRTQIINGRTGRVLSAAEAATIFDSVKTAVNATNPFGGTGIAYVDLTVTQFGPSKLVETTVTRVEGDCVAGAQSFTVQENSAAPEPPKAFNDRLDKNTLQDNLILYILGNKVEVRNQALADCNNWTPSQSGGAAGTLDIWDISAIPVGASFDISFDAYAIPDKFKVEYPTGTVQLETGWRGSSSYNGNPAYPGGIQGTGAGEKLSMFTKGASNTIRVTVTGGESGTAWNYNLRCNASGMGDTGGTVGDGTDSGGTEKASICYDENIPVTASASATSFYGASYYGSVKGNVICRLNEYQIILKNTVEIYFCNQPNHIDCYLSETKTMTSREDRADGSYSYSWDNGKNNFHITPIP